MSKKKFTEEEMIQLRKNVYVLDVTSNMIHFSAEFKKQFWEGLLSKKKPREIVTELGIDPKILGTSRVNGLKLMISKEVNVGKGFRDKNTHDEYFGVYTDPASRVKYLEQLLIYKDQEIDFLKRIVSLNQKDSE